MILPRSSHSCLLRKEYTLPSTLLRGLIVLQRSPPPLQRFDRNFKVHGRSSGKIKVSQGSCFPGEDFTKSPVYQTPFAIGDAFAV